MTWLEDPPPCLLLCFGNSVNRKKCYHIWPLYLFYFDSETIGGDGGLCFEGDGSASVAPNVKSWLRPWLRVTWLEDLLTSKWPGSFTTMAPPLVSWALVQKVRGYSLFAMAVVNVYKKYIQVAQLSQRDRAAGWVSYGQKWKTYLLPYSVARIFSGCTFFHQKILILLM